MTKAFGLDLPARDLQGVGFHGSAKHPGEVLNLSFRAPKDCLDRFLADPGQTERTVYLEARHLGGS
ncbi:hypothetical protein [Kitasatospora sp. NPDC087271]|uniref:hypothetical protein n=1 Tax=Kitasatospora sp. NPDC087271 TaxID=3364067 RepID=UPI003804C343